MTDASRRPTAGRFVLTDLRDAHLDEVLAIERDAATTGWSRRVFEREIAQPETRSYLVVLDPSATVDQVVGYGGIQVAVDEAHITTLTVRADARRRGVATLLLVALLTEARARGATAATLEVRVDNEPARRLYAGLGFRPVGIRPRYYDNHADALIMWAHDLDGAEYGRLLRARADRKD